MWGTRVALAWTASTIRFIPTHVGNTSKLENCFCLQYGSSPRMWGTLIVGTGESGKSRFIPTHVGNTATIIFAAASVAVHPHACGEHKAAMAQIKQEFGSSPRMWGTRRKCGTRKSLARFIPTHVGNTPDTQSVIAPVTVHPHACGEHGNGGRAIRCNGGSSPRMWGTLSNRR